MSRTLRWSAIVLVLACLTAGTAQAGPLAQLRPEIAVPDVGSRVVVAVWDRLVSLFRPVESKPAPAPSGSRQKDSCSGDPFGRPINCH
jgi:hypothetical protein